MITALVAFVLALATVACVLIASAVHAYRSPTNRAETDDVMAIADAVQHGTDVKPCGHSIHDPNCIDPETVARIRNRVVDELAARRGGEQR